MTWLKARHGQSASARPVYSPAPAPAARAATVFMQSAVSRTTSPNVVGRPKSGTDFQGDDDDSGTRVGSAFYYLVQTPAAGYLMTAAPPHQR